MQNIYWRRDITRILGIGFLVLTGFGILYSSGEAWQVENGFAVCTAVNNQYNLNIVSDGRKGAIICWQDYRNGSADIYAQAIDSTGTAKWTLNGIAVCTALNDQVLSKQVSDGQGGAIISWKDGRNGNNDIYAQAIDSAGVVKWPLNDLAICTAAGVQESLQMITDGQGGAIITWIDYRNGNTNSDIYAQAIDSTGMTKWALNGIAICTASNNQFEQYLTSDGQGGAIISWADYRGTTENPGQGADIYAQAIDSAGTVKWVLNGISICTATSGQYIPRIVTDGQGGAIITWSDARYDLSDIYAQAVDSAGIIKWTQDGIVISQTSNMQNNSNIIADGQGGAIICWGDYRTTNMDLYAQAVDSTGSVKWTANGIAICTASNYVSYAPLISDGQGGAIFSWEDKRNGTSNIDIYTQAIDSSGLAKWMLNGVAICTAANNQSTPRLIPDEFGGAIIAWYDYRNGNDDIYVQSIYASGQVPVELSVFYTEPSY
ncbi:MAG: hypothetical protein ACE14V_01985 [bacterium]